MSRPTVMKFQRVLVLDPAPASAKMLANVLRGLNPACQVYGAQSNAHGMALAHVVQFIGPCDPKVVSKEHLHQAEFQMIYVLKGSLTTSFAGQGTHTMNAGDAWLQPNGIKHKVLDYSDGCEVLEIVMPANFKTVELEK